MKDVDTTLEEKNKADAKVDALMEKITSKYRPSDYDKIQKIADGQRI